MKNLQIKKDVIEYLDYLHSENKPFEVCVMKPKEKKSELWNNETVSGSGIAAGWFDDHEAVAKLARPLNKVEAEGVYVSLNRCKKALMARASGRLKANGNRTKDDEIYRITNILIDVDPIRPSGISSSEKEHNRAIQKAKEIRRDLKRQGFPNHPIVDSGNGAQLVIKTDLANNEQNVRLIKQFLHALALKFDDDHVKIDESVFNPSRLIKLPGTYARKGENLPDRPHRRATILRMPRRAKKVSVQHLEKLAASVIEPSKDEKALTPTSVSLMDVAAYLKHYGVKTGEIKLFRGGTLHVLKTCLFNESHVSNKASIIQSSEGTLYYQCFHNSCRDKQWSDARWEISGGDKLHQFYKDPPKTETKDEIRYSFMTAEELIQQRIKDKPLIKGLLEKGGSLLILGQTDSMKSMMTLNIALNLANPPADKRLWGIFDIPKPINTLFIQSENGAFYTKYRIGLMVKGERRFEEALPRLFFPNVRKDCRLTGNLDDEKFQEMLKDMIFKTKSKLIVIDPLISFHNKNENDNVEIRKVLDILTGVCNVTKTACLVIHHTGKTKSGNVFSGRGASALADWASNIVLIEKEDKGGEEGQNDGVLLNIKYLKSRNFIKCPPFDLEVSGELRWSGFFRQPGVGYKW
jgi:hypothetical protein